MAVQRGSSPFDIDAPAFEAVMNAHGFDAPRLRLNLSFIENPTGTCIHSLRQEGKSQAGFGDQLTNSEIAKALTYGDREY